MPDRRDKRPSPARTNPLPARLKLDKSAWWGAVWPRLTWVWAGA